MKVLLVTPYPATTNPYMQLLARALRSAGIDLRVSQGTHPFPLLRTVLRHGRPDVVHLQWHHPFFTAATLLRAVVRTLLFWIDWALVRLLGSRFVWTVHNVVNHERRQERWELTANRVFARVAAALIVHCDAVVPTVAAAYRVRPARVQVVPHGHYIDRYPALPNREDARGALGLAPDSKVLLFFGHVQRYKGLEQLLDAFASLDGTKVRLILLGRSYSTELRRSLTARAARDPRVTLRFEVIPDDELALYLCACDVVVLPYKNSLTSGAAVLAASCSRPILAPAIGCLREFPPDAAILYDPDEPDGLRCALERVTGAPLDAMGSAALHYVEQFPWSLVAQRTESVYRGILPSKQGHAAPAS